MRTRVAAPAGTDRRIAWLVIPLVMLGLASCGPVLRDGTPLSTVLAQEGAQEGAQEAGGYRLQPGDQIEITHILDPDYNTVVVVGPDGHISVPGISLPVNAQGLTISQLDHELDVRFAQGHALAHPFFSLNLRSFGNLQVFVGGDVQRPGYLDLSGGKRNIMQILMAAGGFLPTARRNEVLVLRPMPNGKQEIFSVDLDKVLHGTDLAQDVAIHPLDTVFVPRSDIADFDLWVDQYIRQALPLQTTGNLTYTNNPNSAVIK